MVAYILTTLSDISSYLISQSDNYFFPLFQQSSIYLLRRRVTTQQFLDPRKQKTAQNSNEGFQADKFAKKNLKSLKIKPNSLHKFFIYDQTMIFFHVQRTE